MIKRKIIKRSPKPIKKISKLSDNKVTKITIKLDGKTYKDKNPQSIIEFYKRDGKSLHPTQKPVKLYEWLLANYAKQGDRILDTHLGSGSSAIAAHYGGFDFVGCELDTDYFNAASKRFEQATAQLAMFGA